MEDNSFVSLINSKQGFTRKIIKGNVLYIWDKLNCQMIDEFGVNTDIEQIFWKKNTINRCKIKMLLTDENHDTLIQILESEIALIQNRLKEGAVKDTHKHHARLYRILEERYHRDPKKLTIFEFYNDLNDLKQEREEIKQKDRPRKVANG
jgi:hypothetical protein